MADEAMKPEDLLDRAASLDLKSVVVIGEEQGGAGYLASTQNDPDEVLALLVNAIIMLSISCFQTENAQNLH